MLDENHRRRPQICAGQGVSEEEALKKGTHRLRTVALIVAGGLVLALVGTVLLKLLAPMPRKAGVRANRELSILAFNGSYLNAANGNDTTRRSQCKSCHAATDGKARQKSTF